MDNYRWKYEDCIGPNDEKEICTFAFQTNEDPYESIYEEVLKAKWLHENKILQTDFTPSQNDRIMDKINKH